MPWAHATAMPQARTAMPQVRTADAAVTASTPQPDSVRIARLRRQAIGEIRHDHLREGRLLLEQAYQLAVKGRDIHLRFSLLQHIATLHEAEGALARALELLFSCLKFHQEEENTRQSAMLHLNIGNIYFRIGDLHRAIEQHRRAEAMSARSATPHIRGRIQYALGSDYQKLGRADSATACFLAAERIAKDVEDEEGFVQARTRLGFIHLHQGRLNDALADFTSVLSLPRIEESYFVQAEAFRGLGQVRVASGDYRAAVDAFERAAGISGKHRLRELLLDVLSDLAAAHEVMGQYHAAYAVAQRRAVARDSLFSVQNRTQMNELVARYEAEQREQQILLLEKDNRLTASELQREQLLARQRAAAIELLAQQNANQRLRLDLTGAELREQETRSREKEQHLLLKQKENVLQKAVLVQQRLERNAIAAGFLVLALVSVLLVRYFRLHRRASEARADAAELRADAARNESLRLRTEIAEREREAQRRFSRDLLRAQEEERQRIASDLHDSLAQKLVVIQNRATLARRQVGDKEESERQFLRIADTAVETIAEVRAISHALRPSLLERFGLTAALRSLVEDLGEASEVTWSAEIDDLAGILSADEEIDFYRIVQEAANNTLRHAGARNARLAVRRTSDGIHFELADDGRGFDTSVTTHPAESGMGLHGMQRRAELLGATLRIDSATGHGTRILLDLPRPAPPP